MRRYYLRFRRFPRHLRRRMILTGRRRRKYNIAIRRRVRRRYG